MSLPINIPISSLSAGVDNDGFLVGRQPELPISAVLTSAQFATSKFLRYFNKDQASYGVDLVSGLASGIRPLGTQSQMNEGDAFIVACDADTASIRIKIKTPGVGTWTGLKFYDSTNGTDFNREITGVTDNTNAFKAAVGWRDIVFPDSFIANRVSWTPFKQADVPVKKWILIVPQGSNYTVTTAPEIDGLALLHPVADKMWVDTAASFLGSTTVAPPTISVHASSTDQTIVFFDAIPTELIAYYFAAGAVGRTRSWQYWNGTVFVNLTNVNDPTNDLIATPTVSGERVRITFDTPPAVKATRTFPLSGGGTITHTDKYMLALTTNAVTDLGLLLTSSSSWRTKMLGAAGNKGINMSPTTIKRVSIQRRGGATGTGAVSFQIYNDTTLASTLISFPDTDANEIQNYDIPDMVIADGQKLQIKHASGSRVLYDLIINLLT